MFIGHIAVGFAAKKLAPKASLGTLMVAPMLLDGLWPIFRFAGPEHARIAPVMWLYATTTAHIFWLDSASARLLT